MRCRDAREVMTWGLREALPPEPRQELERHLNACDRCRAEREELRSLAALLARERDGLRPGLAAGRTVGARLALPAAVAGALALAAASVLFLRFPHQPPARPDLGTSGRRQVASHPRGASSLRWRAQIAGSGQPPTAPNSAPAGMTYGGARTRTIRTVGVPPAAVQRAARHQRGLRTTAVTRHQPAARVAPTTEAPGLRPTPSRSLAGPAPVTGAPRSAHLVALARRPPVLHSDGPAYVNPGVAAADRLHPAWRLAPPARNSPAHHAPPDDFVTVPSPQFALAGPDSDPSTARLLAHAVNRYNQQRAIVDPRLGRKIDLEMKGGDLRTLMALLTRKTGVHFYVAKDIRDFKLTVLVDKTPVRDIMRQVVKLFNLQWHRFGAGVQGFEGPGVQGAKAAEFRSGAQAPLSSGARGRDQNPRTPEPPNAQPRYTYSLVQTLRQKLAEEELRRKDRDEMLLNVAREMDRYKGLVDLPEEELSARVQAAAVRVREAGSVEARRAASMDAAMLGCLQSPSGNAAFRLYASLSADQLVSLRNGDTLQFTQDQVKQIVPNERFDALRKSWADFGRGVGSEPNPSFSKSLTIDANVRLDRARPDRAQLMVKWVGKPPRDAHGNWPWFIIPLSLVTAEPDGLTDPGNAKSHATLRSDPRFKKAMSLDPHPDSPPKLAPDSQTAQELERVYLTETQDPMGAYKPKNTADWVDSADVLADLFKKTGRPIIADYYLRVYPRQIFAHTGAPLLSVLNDVADALKSDWQADGGFLRFRRFNYYTERALDVPNRLLARWKADRQRQGYMGLEDLSEIVSLPDVVLNDMALEQAILLKWGLNEWPLTHKYQAGRPLRFFASLTPLQRAEVQSEPGLSAANLSPDEMDAFRNWSPGEVSGRPADGRVYMRMAPPGMYAWSPYAWTESSRLIPPGHEEVREPTWGKARDAALCYLKSHPGAQAIFAGILAAQPSNPIPGVLKMDATQLLESQITGPSAHLWMGVAYSGKCANWTFSMDFGHPRPVKGQAAAR